MKHVDWIINLKCSTPSITIKFNLTIRKLKAAHDVKMFLIILHVMTKQHNIITLLKIEIMLWQ